MTEAPSHLIALGKGRVKVLCLACDGLGLIHPLRYTVGTRARHCRICGCTSKRACIDGCAWANTKRTLCTRCAERIGR
jgi:hypothetical protein